MEVGYGERRMYGTEIKRETTADGRIKVTEITSNLPMDTVKLRSYTLNSDGTCNESFYCCDGKAFSRERVLNASEVPDNIRKLLRA